MIAIAIALAFAASVATPTAFARPSESSDTCKRKKRKKRKKRRKRRAKRKKVTYKTVLRWWKKGLSNDEIVAKAAKAKYRPTKRDLRKLQKKHVGKGLIASLRSMRRGTTAVVIAKAPKAIDTSRTYEDGEINFDSVAAPKGAPPPPKAQKKPGLDRSLRPAAPFQEKDDSANNEAPKTRRVVVAPE